MRLTRQSITNQKVQTLCKESMFVQSGGFDQCKVGIRKWLKTSQGFKLLINSISPGIIKGDTLFESQPFETLSLKKLIPC